MTNKLVVLNEDKNDCAAACVSSIIRFYGGYINMETIKQIINTTKYGTNAYDIIMGVKEIGFNAYGKKVTLNNLKNYISDFPVIAHVKKNNMFHFVVIYKIDIKRNNILYMDPSIGFIKTSLNDFKKIYLGTLIFFKKNKEIPKEEVSNKLLKEILVNILKDKKTLLLLFISSLITFIFSLLNTYYYKIIISSNNLDKKYFINLFYVFSLFILIKNIFSYFRNKLIIRTNYNLEIFINNKVLRKIFNLPYSFHKNKTTGEIISRINDLDSLREILSDIILNTSLNLLLIIISFLIMLFFNYKLTLISILIISLYYLIVKLFRNSIDLKIRLFQENKGFYNNGLIENIEGLESIKNLNIKDIVLNKLNNSYLKMCNINKSLSYNLNCQQTLKNIINDIGIIIFLTIGMFNVLEFKINISDLIFIYMIVSYFIGLIKEILDKDVSIKYNLRNLEKINNLFSIKDNDNTNEMIDGDIIIKNLNYSYSDKDVLSNVDLNIKFGNKILLSGKSGSGKSTLVKILLKYLSNYKGSIRINNCDYKDLPNNVINNSFVYIGQNEKIFTDTFKNNIVLGRNISDKDYENIIDICELKCVRTNDDFLIEEGGFNLSGGERQRIILARALLKKSNYIIIDEALSEVDIDIEKKIISNINKYFNNNTLIYVTHKKEIQELFLEKFNLEERSKNE